MPVMRYMKKSLAAMSLFQDVFQEIDHRGLFTKQEGEKAVTVAQLSGRCLKE
jgi:hypothetical protein